MKQLNSLTYIDDAWISGNPPIIGPISHGAWLGSPVFDGARAFDGMAPDLDLHCQRVINSAMFMLMNPPVSADRIQEISLTGLNKFGPNEELYIRPLIWAEDSMGLLRCNPESSRFCVTVVQMPMPEDSGFSACLSSFRRPASNSAPTDAKAACLYPNGARAMQEASDRGYENAVVLDQDGNVAEFTSANLFAVIDGELVTPQENGTFLSGITRKRVIHLMSEIGIKVIDRKIQPEELLTASEIFNTGNYGKVMFVNRYEDRDFQPGPIYRQVREAYWDYSLMTRY